MIRSRAKFSKDEQDTEMLKDRWHTAHDVCSLAACNIAFEDCKEEDAYDLGATPPFLQNIESSFDDNHKYRGGLADYWNVYLGR